MIRIISLISLALLIFISGCASKERILRNCTQTDWEKKGYDDAADGDDKDLDEVQKCAPLVKTPVKDLYSAGYAKGLIKFCTYEFGLYWGRNGKGYDKTCPAQLENSFLSGYSNGKLEYDKLQIEQQNADSLKKISEKSSTNHFSYGFPPAKSCFSSFDCTVKDKCIQDPQSNFGTDRICQKQRSKSCFSDRDCELEGSCENRSCKF